MTKAEYRPAPRDQYGSWRCPDCQCYSNAEISGTTNKVRCVNCKEVFICAHRGVAMTSTPRTSAEVLRAEELGRTLGAKLAKFADQAEEKLRAAGVEPDERCASCAFRAGTFPNSKAPATGLGALKCLIEKHPFGCHHDKKDGLPTRLCGGFVNILAAETGPRLTEAPWPFSDEIEDRAIELAEAQTSDPALAERESGR